MSAEKKEKKNYKFGGNEIDLENYLYNLNNNVDTFLEHQTSWNDAQRLEFKDAYNNYYLGLLELLNNGSDRFSTDAFGTIVDADGILSDIDNNNTYYNDKGEALSEEDYKNLKLRKLKKYSTFQANKEVANYFKKVGKRLKTVLNKKPESSSNKFDLAKHGFINYWQTLNNPGGGAMDLRPYLDIDPYDTTTGKRAVDKRAKYLASEINNYLNQLLDYDFEGSPFKTSELYKGQLKKAAALLANGVWNNDDLMALNQSGISGDFYNAFFSEEENPNLSLAEKDKLEKEAKDKAEKEKKEAEDNEKREMIKKRWDAYQANNYQYTKENPYNIGMLHSKYWHDNAFDAAAFGDDYAPEDNPTLDINNFLVDPYKDRNRALKFWAALIGMGQAKAFGGDSPLAGYYYVPQASDNLTNGVLVYNPSTGDMHHTFIGNTPIWDRIKLEYLKSKNLTHPEDTWMFKDGGSIPTMQLGGGFDAKTWLEQNRQQRLEEEGAANTINTSMLNGRTVELEEAGRRKGPFAEKTIENPNAGFKPNDILRLSTIAADIVSMGSAFVPVYGTAVSAVTGVGSTLGTFFADLIEDGPDAGDVKNLVANLSMDALGLIPGGGAASKGAKIAKNLGKYATRIIATIGAAHTIANGDKIINSYQKLLSTPSELSVDDWRNISAGLGLVTGGTAAATRKFQLAKVKALAAKAASDNIAVEMIDPTGKKQMIAFSGDDAKAIREAKASGNVEDISKVTTEKFENFKDWKVSTEGGHGLQWIRANGKWLSPLTNTEGAPRVFDLSRNYSMYPDPTMKGLHSIDDLKKVWNKGIKGHPLLKGMYVDPGKWSATIPVTHVMSSSSKGKNKLTTVAEVDKQMLEAEKKLMDPLITGSKRVEANIGKGKKKIEALEALLKTKNQALTDNKSKLKTIEDFLLNIQNLKNYKLALARNINGFELNTTEQKTILDWKDNLATLPSIEAEIKRITSEIGHTTKSKKSYEDWIQLASEGKVHSLAYRDFLKKYTTSEGKVTLPSGSNFRKPVEQSIADIMKKYNIVYKQGGSFSHVRKFQLAGKITNTKSTADWYKDMFASPLMKTWLDSFNIDNFENFNKLQRSWSQNLSNTGYKKGITPLLRNLGVYDRLGEWNKTGTNEVIGNLVQNGTIIRSGNSGDNKLNNYLDGYFGELEYLRHGGSGESWKGHEDDLKNFQSFWKERGLNYDLDPKSGMYLLSKIQPTNKINPDNAVESNIASKTHTTSPASKKSENLATLPKLLQISMSPTVKYGIPRAIIGDSINKQITDIDLDSAKPYHVSPLYLNSDIHSSLAAENQGLLMAAAINNKLAHNNTSDDSRNTAARLEGYLKGTDLINQGKAQSDQIEQNSEINHLAILNQNKQSSHEAHRLNDLSDILTLYNKAKIREAYLSKKYTIWDTVRQLLEYEARQKEAENKLLAKAFGLLDITNDVNYNLKNYIPDLSEELLAVWDKVAYGDSTFSLLTPQEQLIYKNLYLKAALIKNDQIRQLLGIPNSRWSNLLAWLHRNQPEEDYLTIRLAKNGTKLAIANQKARSKDNDRFQKYANKNIKRNEKNLDRISKSLYGYIKSIIK